MSSLSRRSLAALALCASVSALPFAAQAQDDKVRVGLLSLVSHAPSIIADERGYFTDEGLEVELIMFQAAQPMAVAIAAGDVDFGITAITGGLIDLAASDYDERFRDGNPLVNGNHLQISLWGDDHDEGRRLFERLAEGGAVEMPFEPQVWGDTYGGCIDRYGQSWSVNVAGTADE